ncbi:hypothetical protein VDG1235_1319 [Verrucomicrobiia bacterium DG1235]|nr:hypothetical protein VDG1235_1319 [Verrucomicrobiae bacterium DG1235]
MDWLFDNLGKLAPLVIFLLYMISSLKGKGQAEEEEFDPAAAERARKIQEEIRRKILERQRGEGPPTGRPPILEPSYEEPEEAYATPRPARPEVRAPRPTVSFDREEAPQTVMVDPYVQKRKEVEAKLKEAKKLKAEASSKAKSIANKTFETDRRVSGRVLRKRLLQNLGDPASLKSAVLVREVLDPPIGMR